MQHIPPQFKHARTHTRVHGQQNKGNENPMQSLMTYQRSDASTRLPTESRWCSMNNLSFQISCLLNPLSTDVLQPNHSKWYYHNLFSPSWLLIEYMAISRSEEERKLVQLRGKKRESVQPAEDSDNILTAQNWCSEVTQHQICALWVTGQHRVFAEGQRPGGVVWVGVWDESLPRMELPLCINGG